LIALAVVALLSLGASSAHAAPIDAGLEIVGTVAVDDSDPDLQDAGTNYSAATYSTIGGSTTGASTAVQFTDTGDGIGHTASLDGYNDNVAGLAGDYDITLTNNTADTYKVVMGITFSHSTDADGGDLDSRSRTRLSVNEVGMNAAADAELYQRLTSESGYDYAASTPSWTDEITTETTDTDLGTNGEIVSFAETRYFEIELVAGDFFDLEGEFFLDGRIWDTGATFDIDSAMFIFVDGVENLTNPGGGPGNPVPEPSSTLLFPLGLGVIASYTRRRNRSQAR